MNKLLTGTLLIAAAVRAGEPAREPAALGRFYPASAARLAVLADRIAREAPAKAAAGDVVALLVPHAGLEYSGKAAATAYKAVGRGRFDSVIVLGTGHYKVLDGAALYPGAYATSEGSLPYDVELARGLLAASPLIAADAAAHKREHSIEVQLPLIRRLLGPVKLVGLLINTQDLEAARAVGRALARAARGRRVLLVASTDLSHYPDGETADLVDKTTLEALTFLDPASFWLSNRFFLNRGLPHLAVTYCGEGAVTAVLAAARELGATSFALLDRLNSGDVVSERDYRHVVGYAAGAFLKREGEAPPAFPRLTAEEKKELLALARRSAEARVRGQKIPEPGLSPSPRLNLPAAIFVTIRSGSELRGCQGSLAPQETLVEAVAKYAAAAAADARFAPAGDAKLAGASFEIEILSRTRRLSGAADLRPGDGAIVEKEGRSGALLPRVWGKVKSKEEFLHELCVKAELPKDCGADPAARFLAFSTAGFGDEIP